MTQQEPPDPFLTTDEVAQELRCSDDSVLRAIKRGSLVAFKDGRARPRPALGPRGLHRASDDGRGRRWAETQAVPTLTDNTSSSRTLSGAPAHAIEAAGQALADAVAWRDRLSPEDAAIAAGARTPEQIARLADVIRGLHER